MAKAASSTRTPERGTTNYRSGRVTSGTRTAVFFLDNFILYVLQHALWWALGLFELSVTEDLATYYFASLFVLSLVYRGVLESGLFRGQTLALRAVGLRIVDWEGNYQSLTDAILRATYTSFGFCLWMMLPLPVLITAFVPLRFFGLLQHHTSRSLLHDRCFGTCMTDARSEGNHRLVPVFLSLFLFSGFCVAVGDAPILQESSESSVATAAPALLPAVERQLSQAAEPDKNPAAPREAGVPLQ